MPPPVPRGSAADLKLVDGLGGFDIALEESVGGQLPRLCESSGSTAS